VTSSRTTLSLSLVAAVSVGLLSASPTAGYFEAENLRACYGHTFKDLVSAPPGTDLPFGGVRVFAKDRRQGRSRTYCLTVSLNAGRCCLGEAVVRLPRWLRRNAESLRLVVSDVCGISVEMKSRHPREYFTTEIPYANHSKPTFRNVSIPEPLDDRMHSFYSALTCFDVTD
jgi:hypothetical protein